MRNSTLLINLCFEYPEVREKILGQESGQFQSGLKWGIAAAPGGVELVLVAVDQLRVRMRVDFTGDKVERGGRSARRRRRAAQRIAGRQSERVV